MENHPIPQDVTGFKFRVIGSITIKQFGYILAAGIFCLIVFLIHLPILLTIPLMLLVMGLGLGLAFVPIEGRPMDKMLINFFKALPKENQYVYHKKGVNLAEMEMFKPLKIVAAKKQVTTTTDLTKKRELASLLRNSTFRPEKEEMDFFQNIKTEFENPNAPINPSMPAQSVVEKPLAPSIPPSAAHPVSLPKDTALSATPVHETVQPIIKTPIQADTVQAAPVVQMPKQSTPSKPLPVIENTVKSPDNAYTAPQNLGKQTMTSSSTVASDPTSQLNAGFPILPDIPNVVLGAVRDARGKALQYILVEVLDQNEIPVRAFKTNQLGQFTAATPLTNGTYKVIFEDPQKKHEFESLTITLDGTSIFQPLIVTSVDQREKLRRDLFGGASITTP